MTIFLVRPEHCTPDIKMVHVDGGTVGGTHIRAPHTRKTVVYPLSQELLDWLGEHAGLRDRGWHYRETNRKIKIEDADAAFAFKMRWC